MDPPHSAETKSTISEIVQRICLSLDCKAIKNLSTMCKRIAAVIANSSDIMQKLKLQLKSGDKEELEIYLPKTHRKYNTIGISGECEIWDSETWSKIFDEFGAMLRTLSIRGSETSKLKGSTFITILNRCPFLENLSLFNLAINIDEEFPNELSDNEFLHLKSVSITATNWQVFELLTRTRITSLEIDNFNDEGSVAEDYLVSMLSDQNQLRELILKGSSTQTLFSFSGLNDIWNDRPFSKLHITSGHITMLDESETVRNIADFLILNKNSLTDFKFFIGACSWINASIIFDLRNLTALALDVGALKTQNTFFQGLVDTEPNLQLKHLELRGKYDSHGFLERFLSQYPAIERLVLDDCSNSIFKSASTLTFLVEKLPKLENLYVPAITQNFSVLKFRKLKRLNVGHIYGMQSLINFIHLNSSLGTLKIGSMALDEQVLTICNLMKTGLAQIQHLSFADYKPERLLEIYSLIEAKKPAVLKTLELRALSTELFYHFSERLANSTAIKTNFQYNKPDVPAKLDVSKV